jgi:hypothetical protein
LSWSGRHVKEIAEMVAHTARKTGKTGQVVNTTRRQNGKPLPNCLDKVDTGNQMPPPTLVAAEMATAPMMTVIWMAHEVDMVIQPRVCLGDRKQTSDQEEDVQEKTGGHRKRAMYSTSTS